ncbi:MAG TPA: hypothetical protein VNF29_16250 [Candidatus Binataceae bacterium]|nr:hypothetical protein [Candidatus Binataceae bacterium]
MAKPKKIRPLSEVVAALEKALPELDDEDILQVAQVAFELLGGGDASGAPTDGSIAIAPSSVARLSNDEVAVCANLGLDPRAFVASRNRRRAARNGRPS